MMLPNRKSIRLKGYDYSQPGAYFITMNTQGREKLFGKITDGIMHLNEAGKIAQQCWQEIPEHFPTVILDEYIIMPDHIHGIIIITETEPKNNQERVDIWVDVRADNCRGEKFFAQTDFKSPSQTIGSIIRGFKIGVTKQISDGNHKIWQRNYYEHIIRSEKEMRRIRKYIIANPVRAEVNMLQKHPVRQENFLPDENPFI